MNKLQACIQDALDDLISPRTSNASKGNALRVLEQQLALACFPTSNNDDTCARDSFLALQYTFECNIPARILPYISTSTARLENLTSKGSVDDDDKVNEVGELAALLATSLSLLQGIVLIHEPSKRHLGRKSSLEILLELLLTSRHLTPDSPEKSTNSAIPTNLSANVIDTLLCVLVDTSVALRAFESANGVQAVVKILKRAGTPREVRMKCLEFLYFYLLDETPDADLSSSALQKLIHPTPPPTAPATPVRTGKPHLTLQPQHPTLLSRYGSSTYALSGLSGAFSITSNSTVSDGTPPSSLASSSNSNPPRSPRSVSGSSNASFSSAASASTTATSLPPPSPDKESHKVFSPPPSAASPTNVRNLNKPLPPITSPRPGVTHKSPIKRLPTSHSQSSVGAQLNTRTPPNSPPIVANPPKFPPVKSMMMLKKEVDYTPMSPKKVANVTPAARRPGHRKSLSTSSFTASSSPSSSTSSGDLGPRIFSSGLRQRVPGSGVNHTQEPPVPAIPSQYQHLKKLNEGSEKENLGVLPPLKLHKQPQETESSENVDHATWKTTEEKKHLLGTMLGNVDALVEGVRKAGIWGLA